MRRFLRCCSADFAGDNNQKIGLLVPIRLPCSFANARSNRANRQKSSLHKTPRLQRPQSGERKKANQWKVGRHLGCKKLWRYREIHPLRRTVLSLLFSTVPPVWLLGERNFWEDMWRKLAILWMGRPVGWSLGESEISIRELYFHHTTYSHSIYKTSRIRFSFPLAKKGTKLPSSNIKYIWFGSHRSRRKGREKHKGKGHTN